MFDLSDGDSASTSRSSGIPGDLAVDHGVSVSLSYLEGKLAGGTEDAGLFMAAAVEES